MKKDSTFGELIEMCNKIGWDKGIKILSDIVFKNETIQAYLFAGDYNQQMQAQKLSETIIQQNFTIARLKKYREENKIK